MSSGPAAGSALQGSRLAACAVSAAAKRLPARRRSLYALLLCVFLTAACTHPVDIAGGGDIVSLSGARDCARAEAPCHFVIQNEYFEIYQAQAQSGFVFSHWQNCPNADGLSCSFAVGAERVRNNWHTTAPTTTAHFIPEQALRLEKTFPPIAMAELNASFYANIAYGSHARNQLDIFLPDASVPTGLVLYFHGGGFVSGDKSLAYSSGGDREIRRFLRAGFAFATVNYRYLEKNPLGLEAVMRDARRAVQFLRMHQRALNIDARKLAVFGDSAGAGMALWLATRDEAAISGAADPVLRESSRVSAVAALETQATYDFKKWESVVFLPFGITVEGMVAADSGLKRRVQHALNIASISDISLPATQRLRRELDMLGWMSADDPDIYVANLAQAGSRPVDNTTLVHHPLHAKVIADAASNAGINALVRAPGLDIDAVHTQDHVDFLISRLRSSE